MGGTVNGSNANQTLEDSRSNSIIPVKDLMEVKAYLDASTSESLLVVTPKTGIGGRSDLERQLGDALDRITGHARTIVDLSNINSGSDEVIGPLMKVFRSAAESGVVFAGASGRLLAKLDSLKISDLLLSGESVAGLVAAGLKPGMSANPELAQQIAEAADFSRREAQNRMWNAFAISRERATEPAGDVAQIFDHGAYVAVKVTVSDIAECGSRADNFKDSLKTAGRFAVASGAKKEVSAAKPVIVDLSEVKHLGADSIGAMLSLVSPKREAGVNYIFCGVDSQPGSKLARIINTIGVAGILPEIFERPMDVISRCVSK